MSELLVEINRQLSLLDEAHFRGQISREHYRERRRHLLRALTGGNEVTVRDELWDKTVPRPGLKGETSSDVAHEGVSTRSSWWSRWRHRRRRD